MLEITKFCTFLGGRSLVHNTLYRYSFLHSLHSMIHIGKLCFNQQRTIITRVIQAKRSKFHIMRYLFLDQLVSSDTIREQSFLKRKQNRTRRQRLLDNSHSLASQNLTLKIIIFIQDSTHQWYIPIALQLSFVLLKKSNIGLT